MLWCPQVHFRDFLVWLTAFLVTCFAGVEMGLLASIVLSLMILVVETAFPHVATLGRIDKTNVYRYVLSQRDFDRHWLLGFSTGGNQAPISSCMI